jgi:hypothetical protein
MNRRQFLGTAAGGTIGSLAGVGFGGEGPARQLLELRFFQFASAAKQKGFEDFLAAAAVPAMNRAGIEPVGIFKMLKEDNAKQELPADGLGLYLLLPHNSPESFILLGQRLASDKAFLTAGSAVWNAPKSDPAYVRYQSTLMLAFKGCPRVEVPSRAPARVHQLRIYESHSSERAIKKVEMFNEGGEIGIFRKCGMTPVFFGQSLIGPKLPNLTYMLGFEDQAALDKAWGAFRGDPGWLKLKDDPEYKDTVTTVTNIVLRPAAGSQV